MTTTEKATDPPPPGKVFFPLRAASCPEQVTRYAGGSRYRIEKRHQALLGQAMRQALEICRPAVAHALHPVEGRPLTDEELVLKSGARLELPTLLIGRRTQFLSVAVATMGEDLEEACRRLQEQGDLLRSIFLDAAGLAMMELLEKAAFEIISGLARERGFFAGHRLSRGCCGPDMSLPEIVFRLADRAAIGVSLNASLVMTPRKPRSFLAGLTPDPVPTTPGPNAYPAQGAIVCFAYRSDLASLLHISYAFTSLSRKLRFSINPDRNTVRVCWPGLNLSV
jgi:hypothetical protein